MEGFGKKSLISIQLPFTKYNMHEEDDEILVPRKRRFKICHSTESDLENVGLQIWNAEFALVEWLIQILQTEELEHSVLLELGCGTGLAGIILSEYFRKVYLTDSDIPILRNCKDNVICNKSDCNVRRLDFFRQFYDIKDEFSFAHDEFNTLKSDPLVILAADSKKKMVDLMTSDI
jgi:SAM-dependent methyltransferase